MMTLSLRVDEGAVRDPRKHCHLPVQQIERVLPTTKKQDSLLFSYSTHAAFVPIGIFDESGKKVMMPGNVLVRTIYYKRNDSDAEEVVHTDTHPKPSTGSLYWFKETNYHGLGEYRIMFEMEGVNPLECTFEVVINQKELEMDSVHLHGGDVLLCRPCEEKVLKGPYLAITMTSKFRLALLDDMEQGSAVDPFAGSTSEQVFATLYDHFTKNQNTSSSSGSSSSSSSSTDTSIDVGSSTGGEGVGSDDNNFDSALVQFQTQFEQRFFTSVLYTDEKKNWKQIMRTEKKKSISQVCSPMYLLRYIVFLVNRLGTGQVVPAVNEKGDTEVEGDKNERQTRKRSREDTIDNSACVAKIQTIVSQCMVELGKIFDSNSRKKRRSSGQPEPRSVSS